MRDSWTNEAGVRVRSCMRCAKVCPYTQPFCSGCGAPLGRKEDALAIGSVIDKRYRILEKLGQGGMGAVFRVEHVRMSKIMAVKVLPNELIRDESHERFRREVRVVSKLDHPNIISVFDSGETDDGLLYLVMEYVQGRDLSAVLREETRLAPRRAMELAVPVLRALALAHSKGIVHRDIKPANVILAEGLGSTTVVKLVDFGVAAVLEDAHRDDAAKITGKFDVIGTPSCMSPEQARGEQLDRRSDLYSVAAMLFELIAGRPPFIGGPLEVVSKHLTMKPPVLREMVLDVPISDEIEQIIAKGLAKLPEERFQSADEMRVAIEGTLGRRPSRIAAPEKDLAIARRGDWEAFESGFRRQRHFVQVGASVLTFVLAFGIAWLIQKEPPQRPVAARAPLSAEIEPNDTLASANLIGLDVPVKGHLGFRRVPSSSDVDIFELDIPRPANLVLTINGVPNLNLVIELLRDEGSRTATLFGIDDAPVATGEQLTDVQVQTGRYFVRVFERHRLDEPIGSPRENSTDAYVLQAQLEEPRKYAEREPNNRREDAMPVALDTPVLGRAGAPGLRTVIRAGDMPLPTWSADHYRIDLPPEHERICAVVGAVPFSTLKLTALPAKDDARALKHVTAAQGARALCVKNEGPQVFEVRVVDGVTGLETYPLALFSSGPGGLTGALALATELETMKRGEDARSLLAEVIAALPRGVDTSAVKIALGR